MVTTAPALSKCFEVRYRFEHPFHTLLRENMRANDEHYFTAINTVALSYSLRHPLASSVLCLEDPVFRDLSRVNAKFSVIVDYYALRKSGIAASWMG